MNDKFSRKSKTFALRCYWNFWNSESSSEAYKKLYKMGFTDNTMQKFAIGWNEKKVRKDLKSFGSGDGKIIIPEGITIPHIIDKDVYGLRVFNLSLEEVLSVPGSIFPPLIRDNNKEFTVFVSDIFLGYLIIQNCSQYANVVITDRIDKESGKLAERSVSVLFEDSFKDQPETKSYNSIFFNSLDDCIGKIT